MNVATVNGKSYLAGEVGVGTLEAALEMGRGDNVDLANAIAYAKAENLGELQDITFGNAVFTSRPLTQMEHGFVQIAETAMEEARNTALAVVINSRLDDLLSGEF